jgi:putative DNA primase/helicase
MSAAAGRQGLYLPGSPLTSADYETLAHSGISRATAESAFLRRVDTFTGAEIVGRLKDGHVKGDYAGIIFPYVWPGNQHARAYRLRRDKPEYEAASDGQLRREQNKYIAAPGSAILLYIPPGVAPEWLADVSLPLIVTEGEKKALALWEMAWHAVGDAAGHPSFLPLAISGVWNWRGTIGKTEGPDGEWREVKGPVPDWDRIELPNRQTVIVFDADIHTNSKVRQARDGLARMLAKRGADVRFVDLPADAGIKGIDDLIGAWGPEKVKELFRSGSYSPACDLLAFALNDHGNALRIKLQHGNEMLYCHAEHAWYAWDGTRWKRDNNGEALRRAKQTMVAFVAQAYISAKAEMQKFSCRSLDQKLLNNALASLHCELPADAAEFDRQGHLLNFRNGTLDLRTGLIEEHDPDNKITKLVNYDYKPEAECPRFLAFLERVAGSDLLPYLQRAFGYSLTGETSAKAVFILHGSGNNGKTTLLDTFGQIIPEYAAKVMIESLMAKAGTESSNALADLADLRGARYVQTSETEEGQRLNESRLKRITQGQGEIRACRKYENPVCFRETHKLFIDANHLPEIRGTEDAIWSRLHVVPFRVTIPADEIDRELPAKLLAEAEGILSWAVRGAAAWYQEGIGKPDLINAAVKDCRDDMDLLAPFLDEMCELCPNDPQAWVQNATMRTAYVDWYERQAEKRILTPQRFNSALERRGPRRTNSGGRRWVGIKFKQN